MCTKGVMINKIMCSYLSSAQPESVTIHPVNATAVKVSWSNHPHHNTSLHYTSYFTATGAMISHHETVLLADVDSTDVAIDLDRDGYEHNFTLQYIKTCHVTPSPVIKKYFQIQFGPIDYCLNWGVSCITVNDDITNLVT